MASGRQILRKRRTRETAEATLAELKQTFAEDLGYFYRLPRPYYFKDRPRRAVRAGLSRRLRFTILERDGFRCRYCGAPAPDVRLTVDHVVSIIDGGTDDPDNLVAACEDCNFGKGGRSIDPGVW